jgi:hypothetical protein
MRSTISLVLAACLAGCGGARAGSDPPVATEDRSDSKDFDIIPGLEINKFISHTLVPNKTMLLELNAPTLDPFSVRVDAPDGDITLELWGPLLANNLFAPLRARSTLLPGLQTHVIGFVPPETGHYVALVRDAQGRAIPVTLKYVRSMGPAARFNVTGDGEQLFGESSTDPTAARQSWDDACSRWKQQMLDLSGADSSSSSPAARPAKPTSSPGSRRHRC